MESSILKIALIQHPPVFMNLEATLGKVEVYLDEAVSNGADLAVFPETWLPGYPVWLDYAPGAGLWDHPPAKALYRLLRRNSLDFNSVTFNRLQKLVADAGILTVLGAHEISGGTLYNTMIYLSPDGSYRKHRKLMPTYTERLVWGMGDGSTLEAVKTDYGTVGGLTCWEHWMPLARAAMHAQKEKIHIAQWPYVKELHQLCSRHYAFEGQCYVAASGGILTKKDMREGILSLEPGKEGKKALELVDSIQAGDDDLLLKGGSALIRPDASYVMEPVYGETGIYFAEADLDLIDEGHLLLDTDGHYARPDVFTLQVDTRKKDTVTFSTDE